MSTEPTDEDRKPRSWTRRSSWVVGGVLILLGVVFAVQNLTGFSLHNWWALFILIPAIGSFATAYEMWQRNDGKFTASVQGPLWGGVLLAVVAAVFLLDLSWGTMWPIFLILIGIGSVLGAFTGRKG